MVDPDITFAVSLIGRGGSAGDEFIRTHPQRSLQAIVKVSLPGFYPDLPDFYPNFILPGFYPVLPEIYPLNYLPGFYPEFLPGIYPVTKRCVIY